MSQYNTSNGIRSGLRKDGLHFHRFAFVDGIVFYVENVEVALKEIEVLKETAGETGLQIFFEKKNT